MRMAAVSLLEDSGPALWHADWTRVYVCVCVCVCRMLSTTRDVLADAIGATPSLAPYSTRVVVSGIAHLVTTAARHITARASMHRCFADALDDVLSRRAQRTYFRVRDQGCEVHACVCVCVRVCVCVCVCDTVGA